MSRVQLSLLNYQLTAEELGVPDAPPKLPVNRHAVEFWQCKEAFYLRLMNRFMDGILCSQEVRSHEICRLYLLREEALAKLEALKGN